MPIALSSRCLGRKPIAADALLAALRAVDLRDCAVSRCAPLADAVAAATLLQPAGARTVAVEMTEGPDGALPALVAPLPAERTAALALVAGAVASAKALGARHVVLRLGELGLPTLRQREQELRARLRLEGSTPEVLAAAAPLLREIDARSEPYLERACRILFEICRAEPDVRFAIATPDSLLGFPNFKVLGLLFSELKGRNVGYWHDAAAARDQERAGAAPPRAWAGDFGERAYGASLADVQGAERGLPPGAGEIDFRLLRESLPRGIPAVLDVEHGVPAGELRLAVALLRSLGY